MLPGCTKFVRNTWKPDLCSNCFKSLEDHQHSPDQHHQQQKQHQKHQQHQQHLQLSGQDSLTELEQGTNRYQTLSNGCYPGQTNSRRCLEISKWNDTTLQHNCSNPSLSHISQISDHLSSSPVASCDNTNNSGIISQICSYWLSPVNISCTCLQSKVLGLFRF